MKKFVMCMAVAFTLVFCGLALIGCGANDGNANKCKHEHTKENIVAATCTLDGQKTVVCTDCGEVLSVEKLSALGHDLGEGEEIQATCISPKMTIRQCSRCNEVITETFGDALEHDFSAISVKPATCTEPETCVYECSRCNLIKTEPKSGGQGALGHQYVHEPSGDTPVTCTDAGETYFECERCGDHYVEVVAPTGHTPDGAGQIVAPTCTLKGYTLKHCTTCGEDYKVDFVPALEHAIVDGPTIAANCDHMGCDTRVCSRAGCDYEEKFNVTANTAHTFDAKGVCTACGRSVKESFALMCADGDIFAITKNGTKYTVYAPSYKYWNSIIMPANVVQALYDQGVYSFDIKLGSDGDAETKTVAIQTEGGMYQAVNVLPHELKDIYTYTFADANGIYNTAKDGVSFDVYYRLQGETDKVVGESRATNFAISFDYIYAFDINSSDTYLKTLMDYTYDDAKKEFTFTSVNTQGENEFAIRKELLEYYYDAGYKILELQLSDASGQRFSKNLTVLFDGAVLGTSGNTNSVYANVGGIDLSYVKGGDMKVKCYCYDLYGTDWHPDYPMDSMIVKMTFVKEVSANTSGNGLIENYGEELTVTASAPVTENDRRILTYTITVPDHTYVFLNFNAPFANEMIAAGYTDVAFTIKPDSGYKHTILSGTDITSVTKEVNGGVSFDAVKLTAGGDYHIRFYLAETTDIVVTATVFTEYNWENANKLKLATTTGDFTGNYSTGNFRSGYLADDKAILDLLYEAGFRNVDLSMYSFTADCDYMQDGWKAKIAELKDYADSLGMTFVQAHSQGGNALTAYGYDETIVAYTLRQIEICGELGIENIVVHPGFQSGYTKEQWFEGNKKFFDVLLVKAEECGVNVLCENSTSKNLGDIYWANSGADMREFIEYVNNPYFHGCWDTGHGNCEGDQYDDIIALGDEMYAIHFNDNLGNGDFHLLPYFGTLDCIGVLRALNEIGFDGYFTFECDGGTRTNGVWHGANDLPILSETTIGDLADDRLSQEKLLYQTGVRLLSAYGMLDD